MTFEWWFAYLLTSIILSLSPGSGAINTMTTSISHGYRGAAASIAGLQTGLGIHIVLVGIGLGTLFSRSILAFEVLKWAGAAYLIWLGIQQWRAPPLQLKPSADTPFPRRSQLFRQGLFAAVSNPKALLFYGAFLPQFLDPARSLWLQFVVMAGTFAAIECVVEYLLARMANRIRPALERYGKRFNRICGGAFAAMGVALPMTR